MRLRRELGLQLRRLKELAEREEHTEGMYLIMSAVPTPCVTSSIKAAQEREQY